MKTDTWNPEKKTIAESAQSLWKISLHSVNWWQFSVEQHRLLYLIRCASCKFKFIHLFFDHYPFRKKFVKLYVVTANYFRTSKIPQQKTMKFYWSVVHPVKIMRTMRTIAKDSNCHQFNPSWLVHAFSQLKFVATQNCVSSNANRVYRRPKLVLIVIISKIRRALNSTKIAVRHAKLAWYWVVSRKNARWAFYMVFHLMIRTTIAAMKWNLRTLLFSVKMRVSDDIAKRIALN